MSVFDIVFTKSAKKEFEKLPNIIQKRMYKKLYDLAQNPRMMDHTQLTDFEIHDLPFEQLYRVRVGDYRIVYAIEDDKLLITICKTQHRSKVYRQQ